MGENLKQQAKIKQMKWNFLSLNISTSCIGVRKILINLTSICQNKLLYCSSGQISFKKKNRHYYKIPKLATIENKIIFQRDCNTILLGHLQKYKPQIQITKCIFNKLLINSPYNIFMYFHPLLYLNPSNCFYFNPYMNLAQVNTPVVKIQDECKKQEPEYQQREIKIKIYLDVFRQQIMRMRETSNKKCWTQEQDQFLLNLDENTIDWKIVASQIPDTNDAICQRRFNRLKEQRAKWPQEIDYHISRMCELQNMSWNQIKEELNQKYITGLGLPKFTSNKIKERYNLYLKPGICRDEWTVDEDIEIIRIVKEKGKDWTKELKNTFTLKNRTELQIKNRYFGTLKFLEKRVFRKASAVLKLQDN